MHKILVLTLSLLLLAGCASTPQAYPNDEPVPAYTNPPGQSGIEGQVFIGPACPGPQSETTDCPDRPYQATLQIMNPQGELVLEIQTDEEGRFRVQLPSGKYVLHPVTSGRYPTASEQAFTVTVGQFTELIVTYDSGMR
ncbi:MAG: carboxypeptidase regulatory-like domain-containing protein [Chloroflexi bacterium]|nr:carboxypeptidase regulatory-like domain-containing protein [Chloroflexota bacterium]